MTTWFLDQLSRIGLTETEAEALVDAAPPDAQVSILLVDDTPANLMVLQETLKPLGHKLLAAKDGENALKIARRSKPALVLLDVMMPGMDGYEVCRLMKEDVELAQTAIIFCSALGDTAAKVKGLELGAVDFVTKPFEPDEVIARVNAHLAAQLLARSLASRNQALARELAIANTEKADALHKIDWALRGVSPVLEHLKVQIASAAASDGNVLIHTAEDSGAEAVARAIHAGGARQERPIIGIQGGKHLESTANAEPGHFQYGGPNPSRLELADGGTLLLDHLERLSDEGLRSLSDYLTYAAQERAQGRRPVPDTRIIAVSTSSDGRSVLDRIPGPLMAVLGQLQLSVPPLAQRRADIPELAEFLLKRQLQGRGEKSAGIEPESLERLLQHAWPGNLRELEDVIVRSVATQSSPGPLQVAASLLQSGTPLGSYRLLRRLGVGGFGEVWEARHQLLARPAAVKLILNHGAADAKVIERFKREASVTANLSSPHTVTLYDFGVSETGKFYYVMELLDGIDLDLLPERYGAIVPERLAHYLVHACRSLAEAHERGIVHRDIKPSNLFVCRLGTEVDFLKVLDFGLVRREQETSDMQLTQSNTIVGTPAFMSPEAALGSVLDGRSDIYSLCAAAFTIMTRRTLFPGQTTLAIIMGHMATPPPALVDEVPGFPKELSDLILSGLAKDAASRPTARQLARALTETGIPQTWDEARRDEWWAEHRPQGGEALGTDPTCITELDH